MVESKSRGTILIGLHEATAELWGQPGLASVAATLPDEVRCDTVGTVIGASDWYPTSHTAAWHRAIYTGPAQSNEAIYRRLLCRSVDLGFWRVQRLLLKIATPVMLIERSAKLWRYYHSLGTLDVELLRSRAKRHELEITLRNHPFAAEAHSRLTLAETLRHIMSMARAANVKEAHAPGVDTSTMTVNITWE